jgi:hypothetical protein
VHLTASVDPISVFEQVLQRTIANAQQTGQAILDNPAPILPQLIRNQLGQALNLPNNIVRQIDLIPQLPGLSLQTAASELGDLVALGQISLQFAANIIAGITEGDLQDQLQRALDFARDGDFGSAFNNLAGAPLVLLLGHQLANLFLIEDIGPALAKPFDDLADLLPIAAQPLENLGNVAEILPTQAVLLGLPAIVPLNTAATALGNTIDGFIAAARAGDPGPAFDAIVEQSAAVAEALLNVVVAPAGGGVISGFQNLREAIAQAIGAPAPPSPLVASPNALPSAAANTVTLTAPVKLAPVKTGEARQGAKQSALDTGAIASGTGIQDTADGATATKGGNLFTPGSASKGGRHRADTGSFAQGLRDTIKGLTGLGREKKSDKETSGASASNSGESGSSSSGSADSGSGGSESK